jgi:hypothetical protein
LLISVQGLMPALQICTPRFADIFNSASAIGFATGYSLHPTFSDRSGSRQHESFGVAKLGSNHGRQLHGGSYYYQRDETILS